MKIAIVGTGYVGLATGVGFAEIGNEVWMYDKIKEKRKKIREGIMPIYEEGLEDTFKKNRRRIKVAESLEEAIENTEVAFICVGTPTIDGKCDTSFVEQAAKEIGDIIKRKEEYYLVVVKSTVPPGTTEKVAKILEEKSGKEEGKNFGVAMNPEFLREGTALQDFFNPDRVVIGVKDDKSKEILLRIYEPIKSQKFVTDPLTAEFIKYVSNAFLATKISFSNEIGNLCKKLGADVYEVMKGVTMDKRISPYFLNAGIGFGGSCFPKDVKAFISLGKAYGENMDILNAVIRVNEQQPLKAVELLKKHASLNGLAVGILGLAFKPNTDDIRESRSIPIIKALLEEGAKVYAYDPKAMDNMKKIFPEVIYCESKEEIVEKCKAIIIATEWDEFKEIDYSGKIVIDGRKVIKPGNDFTYEGVCW